MEPTYERSRLTFVIRISLVLVVVYPLEHTIRAESTLARGGDSSYGGAFLYPGWSIAHFAAAAVFLALLPFQLSPAFCRRSAFA